MELDLHAIKKRYSRAFILLCSWSNPPKLKVRRRRRRRGGEWGESILLPSRLGTGGVPWAPPAGSGAEPWRKTNLVHSKHHGTLLVARYHKYYGKCEIIISGVFRIWQREGIAEPLVGGSGGWSPPEAETLFASECSMETANSPIFLKFGNAKDH